MNNIKYVFFKKILKNLQNSNIKIIKIIINYKIYFFYKNY